MVQQWRDTMSKEEWFTVRDLAAATKVHPSTITRWILAGALEAYRIGPRSYRIPRRAWEAYLQERGPQQHER